MSDSLRELAALVSGSHRVTAFTGPTPLEEIATLVATGRAGEVLPTAVDRAL